jgi:hypothetical protein
MKLESMNYIGPSMNPILKSGDRLQILPCDGEEIRPGDVIVFIPPGGESKIVHRVVSVGSEGIKTRGDNCEDVDPCVLSPDHIFGRVVYARRRNRRRRVFGGPPGQLFAVTIKTIHAIDSGLSYVLRPAYHWLAGSGIFRRWLPAQLKTRVLSFKRAGGTELLLLMGRQVIGRWPSGKTHWHIRRPFRLFVDETSLPENPYLAKPCEAKRSVSHE